MRTISAFVAACAMMAATVAIGAPTAAPPNPPYAVARGFANILSGWLEIPRGIVYENARIPVVGFLAGPLKGACLATWREIAGITDVLCMGMTRQGLYCHDVPDFVWDAEWIPVVGQDIVQPKGEQFGPGPALHPRPMAPGAPMPPVPPQTMNVPQPVPMCPMYGAAAKAAKAPKEQKKKPCPRCSK